MYIDESKRDGYLMVGVVIDSARVAEARRKVKHLLLPGQERIHFKSERDRRRKALLTAFASFADSAIVAASPCDGGVRQARRRCLERLALYAAETGIRRITIEREDSLYEADKVALHAVLGRHGSIAFQGIYLWERALHEPLLWTADGVAWAYSKGGAWRRQTTDLFDLRSLP